MATKININQYVTIYPSPFGYSKMIGIIMDKYGYDHITAADYINENKTSDGGYQDQLWTIIELFHELFYQASDDLSNTTMIINDEITI